MRFVNWIPKCIQFHLLIYAVCCENKKPDHEQLTNNGTFNLPNILPKILPSAVGVIVNLCFHLRTGLCLIEQGRQPNRSFWVRIVLVWTWAAGCSLKCALSPPSQCFIINMRTYIFKAYSKSFIKCHFMVLSLYHFRSQLSSSLNAIKFIFRLHWQVLYLLITLLVSAIYFVGFLR